MQKNLKVVRRKFVGTNNSLVFTPKLKDANSRMPDILEHTIPISIQRFFTNVDGTIVAKNTVPLALQVKYPIMLLGEFDKDGGYAIALQNVPPAPGTRYIMSFVNGSGNSSMSITGFSGLNDIQGKLSVGDIVHVFTDDITNPNYFVWLVVKSTYGSLASIIGNTKTTQKDFRFGQLVAKEINFFVDDQSQFNESIHFTRADNLGTWKDDPIQPYIFRNPFTEEQGFITIKSDITIDQFQGLNFYMVFAADNLTMDFKVKKIN